MRSKSIRNRIRKITAVLLAYLLLFTMTGCGGSDGGADSAQPGTVLSQNEEELL